MSHHPSSPVTAFLRRHPALRAAARRVMHLGRSPVAGLKPALARLPAPPPKDRVVPIAVPAAGLAGAGDSDAGKSAAGKSAAGKSDAGEHGLLTMVLPRDLLVPRRLEKEGLAGYERESLACFLAATTVAGRGAVLDIGANVGIYAGLAAALAEREVRAFEPSASLVEAARKFAADNDLHYTTEALALGAENGTATFYLSDVSDTSNSLAAGFRESSAQIEVPVETLDSYMARTGVVPAVMKVDTETTEPDVLAGAAKTITEHRPWILCEVLAGRVEDRLTEVLAPFDYHWYHITDEPPYEEAKEIAGDTTYRNLMWLFAPDEPSEEFWTAVKAWAAALAECTPQLGSELRDRRLSRSA